MSSHSDEVWTPRDSDNYTSPDEPMVISDNNASTDESIYSAERDNGV